jgi:hypothetical protein
MKKKWIRLAARLYPSHWRRRYETEFQALLDDASPRWRDVLDVFWGAVKMQIAFWNPRNITVACGLAGLIMAGSASLALPNIYVSRAVLRVGFPTATDPAGQADRMSLLTAEVFSRHSLAEIIQRPNLNLYPRAREHKPIEDVIESMKEKDIKVEMLTRGPSGMTFILSFVYPDRQIAQGVTQALVTKLVDANFQQALHRQALTNMDLLDPASLPQSPTAPNRQTIAILGLVVGLLGGLTFAWFRRRRAKTSS